MSAPWGPIELEPGERRRVLIGASELWLERREAELRIATRPLAGDPIDSLLELPVRCRVATRAAGELSLAPRLADRNVVGRLEEPIIVGPDQDVEMFIGTAIWLVISAGDTELAELPLARPPDTWFGPSPRIGQLCYASRTSGRLSLSEIGRRVDRAVVSVSIANHDKESIHFERICLPVPLLSLYVAGDGSLWTSQVRVRAEEPTKAPGLVISEAVPVIDGERLELIAPARQPGRGNVLTRALGALL